MYFSFKGLPAGVELLPGAEYRDERAPMDIDEDPNLVAPRLQRTTMVLLAAPSISLTRFPVVARLTCRPIVNGVPGDEIMVKEIPMMIVAP